MSASSLRTISAVALRLMAANLGAVLLLLAGFVALSPSSSAVASPAPPNKAAEPRPTRFVVWLEKAVEFDVLSLSNPNRVVVSLPDVKMRLPSEGDGLEAGLVKSFRGGISAPGQARIVIDVRTPVVVQRSEVVRTGRDHHLVLDLAPAPSGKLPAQPLVKKQQTLQPPFPRPAPRPEEIAARTYKPVIVIDPGHGGHDSGAKKNGVVEKDVVLAFSLTLRDKLEASGRYRVVMTRESDVFISLDERRAIAERNEAHLFIAVHADYAGAHARGATIYSLRDSTAQALQRSASSEVFETVLSSAELSGVERNDARAIKAILADLASREVAVTKERTDTFARSIIEFMSASTPMRPNAEREANFQVLKTAKVPSVLIELAYVTNPQDARNLTSEAWRDTVSDSIITAIDNYFSYRIARLPM